MQWVSGDNEVRDVSEYGMEGKDTEDEKSKDLRVRLVGYSCGA